LYTYTYVNGKVSNGYPSGDDVSPLLPMRSSESFALGHAYEPCSYAWLATT